jgi:hypothetical protein
MVHFSHSIVDPPKYSINVILSCPQALGAFPIATQALICIFFWYHATDFVHISNMFDRFQNNSLNFNEYSLQKACGLHFKCPRWWKSLGCLCDVTDTLKVFLNHVCYNTQAMLKSHVMNSLYVTLLTPRFLKLPQGFCKICGPPPLMCTCNSSFEKNL